MATRAFICLGDTTDHGGTVIEADPTWLVYGRPAALVGHKVACPKCKGVFPIVQGAPDITSFDSAVAREGDKTACGATLLPTQVLATCTSGGELSTQVSGPPPAAVAPQTDTLCLECLQRAADKGASFVVRGAS